METLPTHASREAALTHPDRIDALIEADALELCGNVEAAARLRKRSIAGASEVDLNCYAYTLLWRNRIDRAIALLEDNAAAHPDSWNAYDSLAEAHVQNGDLARALVNYTLAARLAADGEQHARIMRRVEELQAKFAQVAGGPKPPPL
jgi:predicted Zn-dependent protease